MPQGLHISPFVTSQIWCSQRRCYSAGYESSTKVNPCILEICVCQRRAWGISSKNFNVYWGTHSMYSMEALCNEELQFHCFLPIEGMSVWYNTRYSKKNCETFFLLNVKHCVKVSVRIVTKLDIVVDIAKNKAIVNFKIIIAI